MPDFDPHQLVEAALAARERAHAPYSNFRVGAALLTDRGAVYTGCNVENASYGLTCCAERVAVFSAIADGESRFVAIAVASAGGAAPCGACRQVLAEFRADLAVIVVDADNPTHQRETNMTELLPQRFSL